MKKKSLAVAAVASCIAITSAFAGCSLVSTNNKLDMEQIVATVDISKADKFSGELSEYASAVKPKEITKRDLVMYYISYGSSVGGSDTSVKEKFNLLLDGLIENAVLIQYCTTELLADKVASEGNAALAEYNSLKSDIEKYEYLLGGADSDAVLSVKYKLYSAVNSAIDNYEKTVIDEEDDEYVGTDTRTTPTNLNTEQDDYYPKTTDGGLDYFIYTGYAGYLLSGSGVYKDDAVENTRRATRVKAYTKYTETLEDNYLVDSSKEDLTDFISLEYFKTEYKTQLESGIVNEYYDKYTESKEEELKSGNYEYINNEYLEKLNAQKENYSTASTFETAMGDMSSSSFLLYSPDTSDSDKFDGTNYGKFGFVYNILLPFNAKQNATLTELKSILEADDDDNHYYVERNKLLKEIETEDQRGAWFNGSTDYSFKAEKDKIYGGGTAGYFGSESGREYLFFEDNLTKSAEGERYKKLQAYDGRYSYNGKVYENEDGSYALLGNKLTIDGMLDEFSAYINYVLGSNSTGSRVSINKTSGYYDKTDFMKKVDDKDEVDYSLFLYATGNVTGLDFKRGDLLNSSTDQYKAMSAVNELQFAYTTDTSVLSQYAGYSVSAYDTSYIKEFEYAAKYAIQKGAGNFAVCAGDYGWHLIYVTYTFDGGDTYTPDWANNIETEGTFENLFYEWCKSNALADVSTNRREKIINEYYKDSTVTKYQKRYQDLLDLGK